MDQILDKCKGCASIAYDITVHGRIDREHDQLFNVDTDIIYIIANGFQGHHSCPSVCAEGSCYLKGLIFDYRNREMKARSALKLGSRPLLSALFLNENLTRQRNNLVFQSRRKKKANSIPNVWTLDGSIVIKDNNRKISSARTPAVTNKLLRNWDDSAYFESIWDYTMNKYAIQQKKEYTQIPMTCIFDVVCILTQINTMLIAFQFSTLGSYIFKTYEVTRTLISLLMIMNLTTEYIKYTRHLFISCLYAIE
ncbi:hypothetical protein CAPTEDRAFT_199899 [Capitella teleta]|uniref:Uncharacterized protein n=1 Tax=Capitella teleta TaxID=283909 RepID=R7UDE1_CAPTE|nr:hypothetical protein CAPTEDRAFT_199899 [Capitella teleta]|eukprot:ELU04400.1 hypothetical protein CAPTEDRAFT_199899 [Capitella teleta]